MIDTVRFSQTWKLRPDIPQTWKSTTHTYDHVDETQTHVARRRWLLTHDPTGLRAVGSGSTIEYVECSLPRLLHGTNGMLLRDQLEIDLALQKLDLLLDEVGDPLDNTRSFTRLDLVWQFRGDPGLFINAHRNCRHKNIRAEPLCYERGSLTWAGSQIRIRFYDKLRQMTKKPGDVIRVEVQLRGSLLRERFGSGSPLMDLDFDECYKVYRQVLLGFCPSPVAKVSKFAHLLATGMREGWNSNGIGIFDLHTQHLSDKQRRRLQKEIAILRADAFQVDWSELLPQDGRPEPVEIEPSSPSGSHVRSQRAGRRRRVPEDLYAESNWSSAQKCKQKPLE